MVDFCEKDNELSTRIKCGDNFVATCMQIHLSIKLSSTQLVSQ